MPGTAPCAKERKTRVLASLEARGGSVGCDLEPRNRSLKQVRHPCQPGRVELVGRVSGWQSWHCLDQPAGLSQVEASLKPSAHHTHQTILAQMLCRGPSRYMYRALGMQGGGWLQSQTEGKCDLHEVSISKRWQCPGITFKIPSISSPGL